MVILHGDPHLVRHVFGDIFVRMERQSKACLLDVLPFCFVCRRLPSFQQSAGDEPLKFIRVLRREEIPAQDRGLRTGRDRGFSDSSRRDGVC